MQKDQKVEKDGKAEQVEKVEMVRKVDQVEQVRKAGKIEKVEKGDEIQKVQKFEKIENVTDEDEGMVKIPRKNRQVVQIFVKVDGSKTFPLMVSPRDKVDGVIRRILNNGKSDVYMTCEGRALRRSDELRSFGVDDGSTVQIMNMMRGGGKHRNKYRAEKKPAASPRSQEPVRDQQEHDEAKIIQNSEPEQTQQEPKKHKSMLRRENAEDEVIRHFEETEGIRKIIADVAKGNNSNMEKVDTNLYRVDGIER